MANPTNYDAVHGAYTHGAKIAKAATGATHDDSARVAIGSIIDALTVAGILGTGSTTRTASCVKNATTTVTSVDASFSQADVGASITGTGISGGTTITAVGSATSITISAVATDSATSTLTIVTAAAAARPAASTVYDATMKCYVHAAAITSPSGGTTDAELRTAVGQVLTAMRNGGIIAGGTPGGPTVWDEDTLSWTFSQYTTSTGAGGATQDTAARTTIDAVATVLKSAGLLALD